VFNPTWIFVGVVYAAAVWLARRAKVEIPLRVAVFFYAIVFVYLYLPLTQDYVNLPVDFVQTLPPWAHMVDKPVKSANGLMNDIVLQIVPWAHQVRESWKSLHVPLWNHLSAAGYPLLANPQSSALSPLRILALPLSLGHAMTAEAAMKILIALTFTYLLCRRRGYSELASTTGASAFGFSTFIIVWLHFPLVTSACLLPAVLYMVDLLAERITYKRFVFAAVVWAAMLFGGHPETAAHAFFLASLYAAWIAFAERGTRNTEHGTRNFFATLAAAMIVAGLLAAPLLAPFAEGITKSKRYQELQNNPPGAQVPFSDWPSFVVMLQPRFFGTMPAEPVWGPTHPESITAFAGFLGVAAWFALLANVIATRAWRSRELFFVLAMLLVLGIVMSWPGVREVFHFLFRLAANARLRLLLALLFAVQTAAAVDLIERGRRTAILIGAGGAGAVLLAFFLRTGFPDAARHQAALLAIVPSAIVLAIAVAAAMLVKRREFVLMLLLAAIIGELWIVHHDWNPTLDDKLMYPRTPLLERMDELQAKAPPNQPFRMVGAGPAFFPNLNAVYGYEDIRPHDPMANGRYIGLLRLITSYDADDYFARWNDFDTRFLDYLNVRYVITPWMGELPPKWVLLYEGRDGRIFENPDVLPRFYPVRNVVMDFNDDTFYKKLREHEGWVHTAFLDKLELENQQMHDDFFHSRPENAPIATSEILEAKPDSYRLHVKAPRYSLIVSSIPWWPGWKIERNGAPAEPIRVNGGFLGFAAPPGELDVHVWFDPWTFRAGAIVAGLTVLALVMIGRWYASRMSSVSPE